MDARLSVYEGCLLGLAVGDAMGYTVDAKTYAEICRDYGPNGLLGYDLVNGYADVSSYTQIAAFVCNGLLLGITRGQLQGRMAPYASYITLALREWSQTQRYVRDPEKRCCWICQSDALRARRCMDPRLPDTLRREALGTMEEPVNRLSTPGSLTAAIPVGLFFVPERMKIPEIGKLGAEAVALTHGDPSAFLSGAVLAYLIAGIVQDRAVPLREHIAHAADAVAAQFRREYPQADALRSLLHHAAALSLEDHAPPQVMERLVCDTAAQVLSGAVYACLASGGDFDRAMIAAVNHSGRSAATGALTGAILGAFLGRDALPEFYLECLAPAPVLRELAADLCAGCPMGRSLRLFDDDWDRKYIQGEPVAKTGWFEG